MFSSHTQLCDTTQHNNVVQGHNQFVFCRQSFIKLVDLSHVFIIFKWSKVTQGKGPKIDVEIVAQNLFE